MIAALTGCGKLTKQDCEEIEEMLYQPGVIEEALCEILNECAYDYCGEF